MTTHDVAVVGSGAAGLVAACRAADGGRSVVVLEKAELLGGTSAVSGGVMWMPANHLMGAQFPDSVDGALAYLVAATGGRVPEGRLRWYARRAARPSAGSTSRPSSPSRPCPARTTTRNGPAPRAAAGWTTCRSTGRSTRACRPGCAPRPTSRRSPWPSVTPGPPRASTPSSSPGGMPRAPGRWAARWSPRS
ncbi:MAG: FAD-dependent oxidoreductase [Pseudonocardia sp.]|nr:FAD-dependent oxidoreductase [Pseudonocardia sp.]